MSTDNLQVHHILPTSRLLPQETNSQVHRYNTMMQHRTDTALSHRGYAVARTEANHALVQELKHKCTVAPTAAAGFPTTEEFYLYRQSPGKLYIPKALGLQLLGIPPHNSLVDADDVPMRFEGALRLEQTAVANEYLEAARDPHRMGGIISLGCGGGKTTIALYIAAALGKRTLVVCHKSFLIAQWRERIVQFVPSARVGLIKAGVIDVDNKDIVIASLQSLAMKEYSESLFKAFGLVVVDEVHHSSARVFSQALQKITAQYTLGLTATLDRKDGLRKVFEWYLGEPVVIASRDKDAATMVRIIKIDGESAALSSPWYGKEIGVTRGAPRLNMAAMINVLCACKERNAAIVDALLSELHKTPGRRVLLLSDRRKHLEALRALLHERAQSLSIGYYVGGMRQEDLDASTKCDIMLATNMMAAEGMDVPALNTLVLASPISSIEQQVGRIQRQQAHLRAHVPVIIDIFDDYSIFKAQFWKRHAFYKRSTFAIRINADTREEQQQAPPQSYAFEEDS